VNLLYGLLSWQNFFKAPNVPGFKGPISLAGEPLGPVLYLLELKIALFNASFTKQTL